MPSSIFLRVQVSARLNRVRERHLGTGRLGNEEIGEREYLEGDVLRVRTDLLESSNQLLGIPIYPDADRKIYWDKFLLSPTSVVLCNLRPQTQRRDVS